MLTKFYKNDFFMIWKSNFPLLIAAFFANIVYGGLTALDVWLMFATRADQHNYVLKSGVSGISVIFLLAGIVLAIVCLFFVYDRFCRSIFSDEGYLTMVIPAKTHELLLGKLLAGATHLIIAAAVYFVSITIAQAINAFTYAFFSDIPVDFFNDILGVFYPTTFDERLYCLLELLQLATRAIAFAMIVYAAIVSSSLMLRKYNFFSTLAAVLLFSIPITILPATIYLPILFNDGIDITLAGIVYNGVMILFNLAVVALLYLLSHRLMHKRFNIE